MSKKKVDSVEEVKSKVEGFEKLLDSIENIEGKKKQLWKEIYENAFIDRMNAYMLFTDAYTNMQSGTASHVQLGSQLSKYIERMNKSNDQLLKYIISMCKSILGESG